RRAADQTTLLALRPRAGVASVPSGFVWPKQFPGPASVTSWIRGPPKIIRQPRKRRPFPLQVMGLPQTTKRSRKDCPLPATNGDDCLSHPNIFLDGLEKL